MKLAIKRGANLLLAVLLLIIACVLFLVLSAISIVFSLVYPLVVKDSRNIGQYIEDLTQYIIAIAASVDQTGNSAFGKVLTFCFVNTKVEGHSIHIDIDDTISEIIGWNELNGSLTKMSRVLAKILNTLDKEHGLKSCASAYWKSSTKINTYSKFEKYLLKYKTEYGGSN